MAPCSLPRIVRSLLALLVALPSLVSAEALAHYGFATNMSSDVQGANSSASVFSYGSVDLQIFLYPRPGEDQALVALTPSASVVGAMANDYYVDFVFSPLNGYSFDLQSLTFDVAAMKLAAPAGSEQDQLAATSLYADLDGILTLVGGGSGFDTTLDGQPGTFTTFSAVLTDPSFRNVTTPTDFRFYIYGASRYNAIALDNIGLTGTGTAPSPVPEPRESVLLVIGAVALGLLAQRRRWRRVVLA